MPFFCDVVLHNFASYSLTNTPHIESGSWGRMLQCTCSTEGLSTLLWPLYDKELKIYHCSTARAKQSRMAVTAIIAISITAIYVVSLGTNTVATILSNSEDGFLFPWSAVCGDTTTELLHDVPCEHIGHTMLCCEGISGMYCFGRFIDGYQSVTQMHVTEVGVENLGVGLGFFMCFIASSSLRIVWTRHRGYAAQLAWILLNV